MKKFFIGLVVGLIVAFPLGINFGKDKPIKNFFMTSSLS